MNPEITFVLREHEGIRGSAARTVRFKNRQRVWSEYEREFALRYCRELSLNEYLGKKYQKMSDLTPVEKRKARLIRACIMAHKGLWRQTVADLCEASCDSSSCDELQELERQTIVRIARCHYLVSYEQLLSDSSVIGKLRHDLGKTPLGHDIRTALARGFYEQALATFHINERFAIRLLGVAVQIVGWESAKQILGRGLNSLQRRVSKIRQKETRLG